MKKFIQLAAILLVCLLPFRSFAGHGMALVTPNFTIGATGVTFTASSNAATCGGGPYWLQMEVRCTAAQLTGTPPSTMQTQLLNWTGPGVTYNSFPWYNSLLNVPNYTLGNAWPDQCTTENYNAIFVPYTGLCPGQTYYFACREWVSGTNSVGPWTSPQAFTVPGTFTPLNFNVAASPTIFCNPGCSTLTATGITGGCGSTSILWTPGNSTAATNVVCPTTSTNYTCMVSTPCNTVTKTVSVTVVPVVSAAFTPVNSTGCTGTPILFTHTGTTGGTHNWAVSPSTGVTITTPTSINPTITFANAGSYTISHTLTIGSCTNVVTTNITISAINPAFTTGSYTQCLNGNSFTFNATTATGSHTFAFNPTAGAPATGLTSPYGPVSFTSPGTFTVTHTLSNGGCTASASSVVVINPQPSATTTQTNTTCGLNNGVVQITNTTGTGQAVTGFSFDGSPIGTQTVVNVSAGTHTVGITNNFGCTTTYTVNITSTPPITALATTFTNATCGNANGSISFGPVTGGTPAYLFSTNGGPFSATTSTASLAAGTYTIVVKDGAGCTFTKTVAVSNIPGPTALSFTTSPSTCLTPAGSVTISVTGGTAAYTYSVDGVAASSTATGLASGTHTATVKDANGCLITATFNIGSVSGPSAASVVVTQATCGNANGSATVTSVTGGVAPYQYSFNAGPFSSTNNVSGLSAGTKTVVIKDANSCTLTVNFTIVNAGSPVLSLVGTTSVNCNGGNTGSFTVSTTGGTPGYNYTISPTNATNAIGIFNTLTAQVYTVTVKDANGCTNTITATVAQPAALTLGLAGVAVPCNGGTNGTITATGGGGTAPYQYSLDGGAFGAGATFNAAAGTHTVTVKDNNGCTFSQTVSITQPNALALTFTTTPNTCVGAAGSVTIGVAGGTPAYSYSIDAIAAGSTATGLASGTHTALVKDSKGCTITATFSIGTISGPTAANIVTGNATCGSSNGTSTVTSVTGGASPYQYSFDGGPFSLSNNTGGLTAGTHTVVVKDANSCTLTVTYAINNTGSPVASISASVNIACNGGSTGSFTVNTTGGTPGYNYTLNPIGTTNTTGVFSGLTAQPYNVTVKDAVGCVTTVTITLTQPTALSLTLTPVAVSCNGGNNGTVTATGSGGISPYVFSLDGGTFGPTSTFTGLSAGTHTVTLKDNNGCTLTQTVSITQPPALALTFTTAPNSCAGPVGSVTIGVTGGTPAYSYSIDALAASSNTASGLTSTTHTALVKDSKGCTLTGTFSIGNISGPVTATVSTTNANCGNANGSATVTGVTGGLAPYQYSFNGGPFSTTAVLSGVTAGTKTLTVLDANGCSLTINFVIGNTGGPTSSVGTLSNVACFGGSSGSFTLNTSGGTPGYNYTIVPTNMTSGTGIFTNLTAQGYTITVKDAAGCVTTTTANITQPAALTLTLTPFQTLCNASSTGSITAAGSGGAGPYQYSLNGGLFQGSPTFTGVASGIFNVTVKDNNGCTLTQTVNVSQPSAITMTFSSNSSKCTSANGTASVTPVGGTPAYSYTWSGGGGNSAQTSSLVAGTYSVTVKDANGCIQTGVTTISATPGGTAVITSSANVTCNGFANGSLGVGTTGPMTAPLSYNWSNSQVSATAVNLGPGVYTCTVTDVFGCKATITGTITEPGVMDFGVSSTSVSCYNGNDGTATVTYFAGGTPAFSYLWAAGGATTATAPNLPAGNYTCTITDANGCIATKSITVTQPTSVTLTSSVTTANCNQSNGSATVSAVGGTPAYSYTWSTSTTGPVLSGAAAGTYTITVKDANNCSYTVAATIPNAAGPSIAIVTQTNVSCNGGNNGVATATASGGVAPYVFQWSNSQNTGTATNLMAGVYSCTVTDVMGCKASVSVTITQPPVLTVSVTGSNPKCFGSLNGTANAGVLGGTGPYNYNWTPSGGTGPAATGLGAGNYIVTVTDAQGCIATSSIALTNPPQMTAAISSTNVSCYGACNASVNGSAANTVGAVTWYWTGGPGPLTTQNISGVCAGTYTLLATDQNSCTATASVVISQPSLLTASITVSGNPSCATYTNGFATVTPAGGTPGYTYVWSGSTSTLATASNIGAGTYTVTVTDTKSCSATAQITLTQPAPLNTTLTTVNVTCNGLNNGVGNLTYSGGTGPYTFLWLPSLNNTPSVNNLPPGTHTVQITDAQGCVTTTVATITQPAPLVANITSTNSNCGQNNGNACVSVTGGTGTLSYLWSSNPSFTNSCISSVVAGSYTIIVTDANGCQVSGIALINDISGPTVVITATSAVSCFGGSNGTAVASISGGVAPVTALWSYLSQTTTAVSNLPAGLHSITVKDAANCVSNASVNITQPTQVVSAITSVSMVTCNGSNNGTATMLVNGGTPGYTYTWTPTAQSSSVAVSLGPGTYTCAVKDANGCPTSQTVSITQPNPLVINSFTVTNVLCNGNNTGQIATSITGGTPVYTYVWTPTQPANPVITNLGAGSYTLVVTDTKSCSVNGSYNITQPSAMFTSATATPATCGNANGSATVTVGGGTPGYTYSWNTPPPQSTPVATGMAANTWICTVTDNNGCVRTQSITVPNAPGPTISAMTFTPPLCFGQQNGSMALGYTSGTAPYTFLWNNPGVSTTSVVAGVGAGVYSATVTDVYGCTASGVVNVTQPNILILNTSPTTTICYGQVTQIYGAGSGGTQPYSYTWTPSTFTGGGPFPVTPTVTSTYQVNMTDANGCVVNPQNITVNVTPQLLATGSAATRCDGATAIFAANITSPGNGGPYSYSWSNGSTNPNVTVVANYATTPNIYTLTVSDGCSIPDAVALYTLDVNPLPSGTFSANITKGCVPLAVNFTALSSSPSDTYAWDFGNEVFGSGNPGSTVYSIPGLYNVGLTITNQFGCKKDTGIAGYIEAYGLPTAEFSADPWTTTILQPDVQFTNLSSNANTYFWDFGDYNSPSNNTSLVNPAHDYENAGTYVVNLVAISSKGCADTVQHTIEVQPDYAIYIPNAFTPDGNGKNDIFQPKGIGIDENNYRMYIFDRWGEIIYTSDNFSKGWDGSVKGGPSGAAEEGVYVYKIYLKDLEGNDHQYVGHVTCLPREAKIK